MNVNAQYRMRRTQIHGKRQRTPKLPGNKHYIYLAGTLFRIYYFIIKAISSDFQHSIAFIKDPLCQAGQVHNQKRQSLLMRQNIFIVLSQVQKHTHTKKMVFVAEEENELGKFHAQNTQPKIQTVGDEGKVIVGVDSR